MTTTDIPMNHACELPSRRRRGALRRATHGLLFAIAAACLAPASLAADAEALFKEGKKLASEKKYDEACPKLAESYKLSATPATLIELALCHEKQGKLATAWGELLDAETDARKAGRADLEARARGNSKALEGKLPRITVALAQNTPDIEITIDGQKIDIGSLGKGRPVDPGEHKVVASAPGRKSFETTLTLKQAEKKTVAIPALAEDASAAKPAKPEDKPADVKPAEGSAQATTTTPDKPETKPEEKPKADEDAGKGPIHRAKRLVIDVGVMAGGQFVLGGGSLADLANVNYEYRIADEFGVQSSQLAPCADFPCRALTDPAIGVPVGGQLFVGYALDETMHIGGRVYGSYLVTGGYSFFGGPSLSKRIGGKLWVGGSLLVGLGAQKATITGARGEVPSEWEDLNGADEVAIDLTNERGVPKEANVNYDFTFGASGEVSYAVAEFGKGKSITTGTLVISAWPTVLKTWNGFAAALPVGIGYRFH